MDLLKTFTMNKLKKFERGNLTKIFLQFWRDNLKKEFKEIIQLLSGIFGYFRELLSKNFLQVYLQQILAWNTRQLVELWGDITRYAITTSYDLRNSI